MEHSANAGEILHQRRDGAALDPPCSVTHGMVASSCARCRRRQRSCRANAAADQYTAVDLSLMSGGVRDDLREGSVESEHRQVTVAFVHFDGTDELLPREGREAVAERLDRLVGATQEAVARHELCFVSSDADVDGGELILIAAAPRATDNDEERMLRAVRESRTPTPGSRLGSASIAALCSSATSVRRSGAATRSSVTPSISPHT